MTELAIRRFASRSALESALEERLARAIAAPTAAALMLSGGATPLPAYRALGARPGLAPAAGLRVLFSDDRYVPADSPASNYHQTQPLLAALALAPGAVLRVRTELPLEDAAHDYEDRLAALLRSGARIGLGLLGLGADGHTASLFGAADLERARGRLAIAVHRPDGMSAVSVTPELLARLAEPVFVVAGADKRAVAARLIARDPELTAWRAVQGCAQVELWLASAQDP
ncbi:MAG TPA: 6-phosphogluconolactonase [Steroidobacteraceae bacterium]|nr:6-phosphogluconolactonase [Steroidobacteraceae bacterium]